MNFAQPPLIYVLHISLTKGPGFIMERILMPIILKLLHDKRFLLITEKSAESLGRSSSGRSTLGRIGNYTEWVKTDEKISYNKSRKNFWFRLSFEFRRNDQFGLTNFGLITRNHIHNNPLKFWSQSYPKASNMLIS